MYVEFVLHGADQGTVAESKNRRIIVDVEDGQGQNAADLRDQVMEDDLAKKHVALAHIFEGDGPLPESSVTVPAYQASPKRAVLGAIELQTRDTVAFQSFVNFNQKPTFMTYRLANHLVDVITAERRQKGLKIPEERPKEVLAMEELQAVLGELPSLPDLPHILQNQVHSLKTSVASRIENSGPKNPEENTLARDRQYLNAAIEFGSSDGDFQFLNRSVDLELDSRSVLCDTDGTPLPFFKDRVQEILTSQFPLGMGKTVTLEARGPRKKSELTESNTRNPFLRVLFAHIEGPRMQRALKMIQDELTIKDEPSLVIRGSGNAIINDHISKTPDRRLPDSIAEFQEHVPFIYTDRLGKDHDFLRRGVASCYRSEKDLLVEARVFVEENAQEFEAEYREFRRKLDPAMAKTQDLTPSR